MGGDVPASAVAITETFRSEQCIVSTSNAVVVHEIYSFIHNATESQSLGDAWSIEYPFPSLFSPSIFWEHPLCPTAMTAAAGS